MWTNDKFVILDARSAQLTMSINRNIYFTSDELLFSKEIRRNGSNKNDRCHQTNCNSSENIWLMIVYTRCVNLMKKMTWSNLACFFLGKSEPKKRGKRHFVSTCCHLLFLALIFFVEIQSEFIFICYNYSFESPLVKMRPNPQYKHISYSNCLIHRAYINKNHTATQQPNQHTHTHTHIPIQ